MVKVAVSFFMGYHSGLTPMPRTAKKTSSAATLPLEPKKTQVPSRRIQAEGRILQDSLEHPNRRHKTRLANHKGTPATVHTALVEGFRL